MSESKKDESDFKHTVWCVGRGQKFMSGYQDNWCGGAGNFQYDSIEQAISAESTDSAELCKACAGAILNKISEYT